MIVPQFNHTYTATQLLKGNPYYGLFGNIEGIDGAGKTTFIKLFTQWFDNSIGETLATKELREPIRSLFLSGSITNDLANYYLIQADRAEHIANIKPLLQKGLNVISDRGILSTLVFQKSMGHHLAYVLEGMQGLYPDFWVILDLPASEAVKRFEVSDRFEAQTLEAMEERRQDYLVWADDLQSKCVIIDATLPPKEMLNEAINKLRKKELI